MSWTGRLTASRMMARVRTPPAGMPAAPTLDAVAVTLGEESGGQGRGPGKPEELASSSPCRFSGEGSDGPEVPAAATPHSQDSDDLHKVQGSLVQLCNEHRGHTLEERRTIHVDRGTDREDEATDVLGHAVPLLHTLHHQWQRGGAEGRSCGQCVPHPLPKPHPVYRPMGQSAHCRLRPPA